MPSASSVPPDADETESLRRRLAEAEAGAADLRFLRALPSDSVAAALGLLEVSNSQLRQDLLVLAALGFVTGGFFVEIGAGHHRRLSNTALLEQRFGWDGILVEPASVWHDGLRRHRRARLDTRCVWSRSGETLVFRQTPTAELSTVAGLADRDFHAEQRRDGLEYEVTSVTLDDLLDEHGAPERIDYLSIDTEGAEHEILAAHDFGRRRFSVLTCEHNQAPWRSDVRALLEGHGYVRVLPDVSRFDDWYVDAPHAARFS